MITLFHKSSKVSLRVIYSTVKIFLCLVINERKRLFFGAFFKTQSDSAAFTHSNNINDWENEHAEENVISPEEMHQLEIQEEPEEEELNGLGELSELDDIDDLRSVDSFSDVDERVVPHFKGLNDVKEEDLNFDFMDVIFWYISILNQPLKSTIIILFIPVNLLMKLLYLMGMK